MKKLIPLSLVFAALLSTSPAYAGIPDYTLLAKKNKKLCLVNGAESHYRAKADELAAARIFTDDAKVSGALEKLKLPAAFNSLLTVLSVNYFIYPPTAEQLQRREDEYYWPKHPITFAQLAVEQAAIEAAASCRDVNEILGRLVSRNQRIVKLLAAYEAGRKYVEDLEVKVSCQKDLITYKDFGMPSEFFGTIDFYRKRAENNQREAKALGLSLRYLEPGLANEYVTMEFGQVGKGAPCSAFVLAEKHGVGSVNALDAAIGKVFLPKAEMEPGSATESDTAR